MIDLCALFYAAPAGDSTMKKEIHPEYREIIVMDLSAEFSYLTRSTVRTKETMVWTDGNEYPVYKTAITSMSHPFYTGKQKFVDSAGRIEKFGKRYQLNGAQDLMSRLKEQQAAARSKANAKPATEESAS